MSDPDIDKVFEERKNMDAMSAGELQAYLAKQEQVYFNANYSKELERGAAERKADAIGCSMIMALGAVGLLFGFIKLIKVIWFF